MRISNFSAMAETLVHNEEDFDAFVLEKLDNQEYSKSERRISESEAKAILDKLYGENRKKAIRETIREWKKLSFRVRTWLQGDLGITQDGKFGPTVRDALIERSEGREPREHSRLLDAFHKLFYFGALKDGVPDGMGVSFRKEGTLAARFEDGNPKEWLLFLSGPHLLSASIQNAPSAQESMKTAAFEGVVFQGQLDKDGKPQEGLLYMANNGAVICGVKSGEFAEPETIWASVALTQEQRIELAVLYNEAEELKKTESAIDIA